MLEKDHISIKLLYIIEILKLDIVDCTVYIIDCKYIMTDQKIYTLLRKVYQTFKKKYIGGWKWWWWWRD